MRILKNVTCAVKSKKNLKTTEKYNLFDTTKESNN